MITKKLIKNGGRGIWTAVRAPELITVTIKINTQDYADLCNHEKNRGLGRLLVAVEEVVSAPFLKISESDALHAAATKIMNEVK
jgi:hypothetical protein